MHKQTRPDQIKCSSQTHLELGTSERGACPLSNTTNQYLPRNALEWRGKARPRRATKRQAQSDARSKHSRLIVISTTTLGLSQNKCGSYLQRSTGCLLRAGASSTEGSKLSTQHAIMRLPWLPVIRAADSSVWQLTSFGQLQRDDPFSASKGGCGTPENGIETSGQNG